MRKQSLSYYNYSMLSGINKKIKLKILPTRLWRLIEFLFNNLVWGKTKSELAASGGGAKCICAESKSVKARRPDVSVMGSVKSSASLRWAPTKRWKIIYHLLINTWIYEVFIITGKLVYRVRWW